MIMEPLPSIKFENVIRHSEPVLCKKCNHTNYAHGYGFGDAFEYCMYVDCKCKKFK